MSNLSLSFPISEGSNGFFWLEDFAGCSTYAPNQAKAKRDLRKLAEARVIRAKAQEDNYRRHIIGCNDGTILLVEFKGLSWGYSITGPGRKHASSCWGADTNFDEEKARAQNHAAEAYGGVAWQHPL